MTRRSPSRFRLTALIAVVLAALLMLAGPVSAHPEDDGAASDEDLHLHDRDAALEAADDANPSNIISDGPNAKVIKNLDVVGRGERNAADATTDVWAHDGYAYTGTFNNPCGGDPEAGIWVWDVHNKNKPSFVTVIPSPAGSRTNDVRVEAMNSGDILVHSNESCAGGPGGFEIYDVGDPADPVLLSSVQTDDVNLFLQGAFGFVDIGVHNLWLFTQGENDYVAATVESEFGNFQIFDITDPTAPSLVGFWGAEQLAFPGIDWVNLTDFGTILAADAYLFDGFGASANRFLHDVTISDDGTMAYLANWDAGLVLLDISDPASPSVVSVAIDPVNGSLDGEVNSHSVWPSQRSRSDRVAASRRTAATLPLGRLPLGWSGSSPEATIDTVVVQVGGHRVDTAAPGSDVESSRGGGRRSRRRRSWALAATMMVEVLIATAAAAGGRLSPAKAKTPAAIGMASRL